MRTLSEATLTPTEGPVRFQRAEIQSVNEQTSSIRVRLRVPPSDKDALIVFTRIMYPGYEITWNGQKVRLATLDGVLPAVRLPAGVEGELQLLFNPISRRSGLPIACSSAFAALLFCIL